MNRYKDGLEEGVEVTLGNLSTLRAIQPVKEEGWHG